MFGKTHSEQFEQQENREEATSQDFSADPNYVRCSKTGKWFHVSNAHVLRPRPNRIIVCSTLCAMVMRPSIRGSSFDPSPLRPHPSCFFLTSLFG